MSEIYTAWFTGFLLPALVAGLALGGLAKRAALSQRAFDSGLIVVSALLNLAALLKYGFSAPSLAIASLLIVYMMGGLVVALRWVPGRKDQ